LRDNETRSEKILWSYLSKNQRLGFRFKRQHPVGTFVADFYCHKANLVVEVDGRVHNEKEQRQRDQGRNYMMMELGLKVLRFSNEQVENDIDSVLKEIDRCLTGVHP
jgi:very-short-patch-repair endonuclease